MLDSLVGQLKQQQDKEEETESALSPQQMTIISDFWFNAAQDRKVCARLQEEGLPITLYTFMRE